MPSIEHYIVNDADGPHIIISIKPDALVLDFKHTQNVTLESNMWLNADKVKNMTKTSEQKC